MSARYLGMLIKEIAKPHPRIPRLKCFSITRVLQLASHQNVSFHDDITGVLRRCVLDIISLLFLTSVLNRFAYKQDSYLFCTSVRKRSSRASVRGKIASSGRRRFSSRRSSLSQAARLRCVPWDSGERNYVQTLRSGTFPRYPFYRLLVRRTSRKSRLLSNHPRRSDCRPVGVPRTLSDDSSRVVLLPGAAVKTLPNDSASRCISDPDTQWNGITDRRCFSDIFPMLFHFPSFHAVSICTCPCIEKL